MTLSNAIEIVQNEHPEKPVKVIAQYVKSGYRDFALKSRFIRSSHSDITLTDLDITRGRWHLRHQLGFDDISSAAYTPFGVLDVWYNGVFIPPISSAGLSNVSYTTNHALNGLQLALIGSSGFIQGSLLQLNTFGFDPRIQASTDYSEDLGLSSPDFEFYGVYHALKFFNMSKNLTVQASYFDRELTRIVKDAKKEIAKLKTTHYGIQVVS